MPRQESDPGVLQEDRDFARSREKPTNYLIAFFSLLDNMSPSSRNGSRFSARNSSAISRSSSLTGVGFRGQIRPRWFKRVQMNSPRLKNPGTTTPSHSPPSCWAASATWSRPLSNHHTNNALDSSRVRKEEEIIQGESEKLASFPHFWRSRVENSFLS